MKNQLNKSLRVAVALLALAGASACSSNEGASPTKQTSQQAALERERLELRQNLEAAKHNYDRTRAAAAAGKSMP